MHVFWHADKKNIITEGNLQLSLYYKNTLGFYITLIRPENTRLKAEKTS